MFDSPAKLVLGLLTGIAFGFLLQKGQAAKHSVIVEQLRLRDWTVLKIMGTSVAVGAVGFHVLLSLGLTHLAIKPAELGGVLTGAFFFGVGLAILGYCPGTTVAAVGEGNRDAAVGLVGMFAGALAFVALGSSMQRLQRAIADWGKATWPSLTESAAWPWVLGVLVAAAVGYAINRAHSARRLQPSITAKR